MPQATNMEQMYERLAAKGFNLESASEEAIGAYCDEVKPIYGLTHYNAPEVWHQYGLVHPTELCKPIDFKPAQYAVANELPPGFAQGGPVTARAFVREDYTKPEVIDIGGMNKYAHEHGRMQTAITNVRKAYYSSESLYTALQALFDLHEEITGIKMGFPNLKDPERPVK